MTSPALGATRRARSGVIAALAFEAALALVDGLNGQKVILTTVFVIAPVALSAVGTPRQVAGVGAIGLGLALLSGVWDHYLLSLNHVTRLAIVAAGSFVAVIAAGARQRAEEAALREAAAHAESERARRDADTTRVQAERLVEQLRATREQLDRTLGALAEAVTVEDTSGRTIFANQAALELMGLAGPEELLAVQPGELFSRFENRTADGALVRLEDLPGRRLLRGEAASPLLTRWKDRASGEEKWLVIKSTQFRDDEGRPLAVNVIQDVTEAKDAELRERFLAHAGEVLSSSLDFEATLRRVAQLVVPELADWCGIELVDEREGSRQLAVAHIDPSKIEFAHELRRRYPPDPHARNGLPGVLRTGQPELYPVITDELLAAGARDEEHLRLIREVQMRSVMIVPMRTGETVVGAITFVAAESVGAYDEDDLSFAMKLAARAATAVENARLYHERSQTAETLQRSLLPTRLPSLDGWRAATLYRPADRVSQVGGDFFDLFGVGSGFTVVLGDVTGKGVAAAALTALVRHSAKTAALLGLTPAGILDLLNRILLGEPEMSLVTVVCAQFRTRPGEVTMTVASAGHPPPLRRREGEPPDELGGTGVLLGVEPVGHWPERAFVIEPGDSLLFYTDGVTDTPGVDDRFGEIRLRGLLVDSPAEPHALLHSIDVALRGFRSGTHGDDTALLALQLLGDPAPPPVPPRPGRQIGVD